jgi:hypothetical protein
LPNNPYCTDSVGFQAIVAVRVVINPAKGDLLDESPATSTVLITIDSDVQSKCGACKTLTTHVVLSMEADCPLQVRCSICERSHKYRPPPKSRAARARKKNPEVEDWAKFSPKWDKEKAITYSTATVFSINDLIHHSKFGLGKVRQNIQPNKIRVLFEDGIKLMICGN